MTTTSTSRRSYLKKYVEHSCEKKRNRRRRKTSNLAVHDDDIDWQSLAPLAHNENLSEVEENNPDEAPVIAGIEDDSIRRWQPLSSIKYKEDKLHVYVPKRSRMDSPDLSPERRNECYTTKPRWEHIVDDDVSPVRYVRSSSSDLSPQRREIVPEKERRGAASLVPQRRLQKKTTKDKDYKRRRPHSPLPLSSKKLKEQEFDLGRNTGDFSPPRRQPIEHKPFFDGSETVTQEYNCSVCVTNFEDSQSLPGNSKGISVRMKAKTSGIKKIAQDKEHAFHQCVGAIVCDHHIDTIYRDKEGHKIDPASQAVEKEEKERLMHDEDKKFILWGRGIAQSKNAREKLDDDLYEMSKPLARYAEDEDLERMLKERERDGDPMLAFIKKKSRKELPKKEKPTFKGSTSPNRFGIKPGFRWDGVDRSNGFERAWFTRESNKKAFDDEAYKWSIEDM